MVKLSLLVFPNLEDTSEYKRFPTQPMTVLFGHVRPLVKVIWTGKNLLATSKPIPRRGFSLNRWLLRGSKWYRI